MLLWSLQQRVAEPELNCSQTLDVNSKIRHRTMNHLRATGYHRAMMAVIRRRRGRQQTPAIHLDLKTGNSIHYAGALPTPAAVTASLQATTCHENRPTNSTVAGAVMFLLFCASGRCGTQSPSSFGSAEVPDTWLLLTAFCRAGMSISVQVFLDSNKAYRLTGAPQQWRICNEKYCIHSTNTINATTPFHF
jgi:hypothetical protein